MNAAPYISKLAAYLPSFATVKSGWALPKPRPIARFDNEEEVFRKRNVLVTDTRFAYIDPYDRTLKTYMLEHILTVDKSYYRGSAINRRLCKILLFSGCFVLLVTFILDLLDSSSRGFILVYLPALLSVLIGAMVWRDMRPKYKIEWRMRDGSMHKYATEPLFSEWMTDSKKRETYMDELTEALNKAISATAWWPSGRSEQRPTFAQEFEVAESPSKPRLTLVTDKYQ